MADKDSKAAGTSWNPFLRACLKLQRKSFVAVIVFSFAINLLMLTVPLYLLQIFNRVVPSKSTDTLIFLTGIVVVAVITLTILESLRRYIFVQFGSWLDSRLGGLVLSGSIVRSVDKCRNTSAQGLRDLGTVRRLLAGPALFPILDAPWTPIFLIVLFMLHPVIGVISLVGAVGLFVLALINELSTRGSIIEANAASTKAENYATAILRNSDAIEAMGMRNNVVTAWEEHHDSAVNMQTQTSMRANGIAGIAKFVRIMLQIVVIGTAGLLVLNDQLSAGGLIASVLLMRRAVAPMDRAIGSWKVIVKARNSFNNVSARLDQAAELNTSSVLPVPHGSLSARHASYTYPHGSKPTLRDVTFKAKPGEVIGLAGDTAAGKSTLARLLVGIAKPDSGYIRLGGIDLALWSADALGPYVGYLPQNTELFSGTVRQNIARMGEGDFDAVVRASQLAGVHKMINLFPDGYDTEIGEDGAYLSGGQRQRIALARAIYGMPRLVILDEPDANLDAEGRAALAVAIADLKRNNAIVIIISHQNSVLDCADKLLILRKGKIEGPVESKRNPALVRGPVRMRNRRIVGIDPLKQSDQ